MRSSGMNEPRILVQILTNLNRCWLVKMREMAWLVDKTGLLLFQLSESRELTDEFT